jgi:hypothetical protein
MRKTEEGQTAVFVRTAVKNSVGWIELNRPR